MKAVDFRRQLEQRFELRTRLCELEQRLVELELEHLGSPYFIVKRERYIRVESTASWEIARIPRTSAAGAYV